MESKILNDFCFHKPKTLDEALVLIDKYQDIYDPASGTLHYEGGRGGGPYYLRVTGWEEDGDRLTLHYEEYSPATGEPYEDSACLLTVRLLEDGTFRYLGNHKA